MVGLHAQPANDNCSNAIPITISGGTFGIGVFYSDTVDLTGATIQLGEYFHPVQVSAGTDKKSVWYSFYLPTARAVELKLMQPHNDLPEDAVGFTVYYSNSCLPGSADIPPAKLTPLNKFGSTYNPCLLPGHYLVQVSGKYSANDSIFLQLTIDYPQVLNQFDRAANAQNIGILSGGWHTYTFDVGCQTIDSSSEVCPGLGANYQDYTQTTWHVFTTDNFIDLLRFEISEAYNHYTGNLYVGVKLYEGDIRTTPLSSLTLIDGCKVLHPTGTYYGDPYYAGISWLCELKPNTTYSLQLFYHKNYSNIVRIRFYERGSGITKSPNPSNIDPSSQLGVLPSSPTGAWTYGNDVLACNAFIRDNPCGTVNPSSGVVNFGGYNYVLSTWYTFTLSDDANVRFVTDGKLGKFLYQGDVTSNCNLPPFWKFTSGDVTYNCLPAGTYSLQILGKLDTLGNITSTFYNNLGMAANVSIQVTSVNIVTEYQLTSSGEVDSINHWNPLPNNVTVYADTAYFGCQNTVLPANGVCNNGGLISKKAIYRTIYIDRPGILTVGGYSPYLLNKLYRGDASELATQQNAFSYGQYITGLTELFGCTDFYYSVSTCVEPGVYTLVTFGDSTDVGRWSRPWFRFNEVTTQFYDPANPNNLGDITSALHAGTVTGTVDYFSCLSNPLTIDGQSPCYSNAKQIYREFYISEPLVLNISTTTGTFRLFYGRISDGVGTVSANIPGYGNVGCRSSFNANVCQPLQPGWYTIVNYGYGGTYDGPTYSGGMIGWSNNVSLWLTPPLAPPNFNRPHKAYYAGITDFGPNSGTTVYPNMSRTYTFATEKFNCIPDTPFSAHPIDPCPTGYNRVAYYIFRLTKESFVSIYNIPSSMPVRVYPFDVRTDSVLMTSVPPVQSCIQRTDIYNYERLYWTWTGKIDLCRLQPGYYTLVVFANDGHIGSSVTPILYVDSIYESRFDNALHAYDFGEIPGDSTWYYGKIGDVNPINPNRSPSDDFISCLTGSQPSDPGLTDPQNLCWNGLYPYGNGSPSILYPIDTNEACYYGLNTTNVPIRRNLWYTFVVNGPGRVYVTVRNKTPGKYSPVLPFTIYKSDVDGTLPFSSLANLGELDSTYASGLTYVLNNSTFDWWGCAGNLTTINFTISPCDPVIKRRFYVVVDEHAGMMPSNEVDVGVRFDRVPYTPLRYDHYSQADVINGLNQVYPPYTPVALGPGTFVGDTGYFACATKDPTDQNTCGTRTLWYKFTSSILGKIRINYTIDGVTTNYDGREIMLFKEIIPGDSTSAGLKQVPLASITVGGTRWGEGCLGLGTYYIMLTGCSYTIENVVPRIWLLDQWGDLCTDPVPIVLNAPGSVSNSVVIDCHTIGEAFGEDGSNMGCLFGPQRYKSTWFKVDLNFTTKVDLSFQLAENTTALPNQIRYRVMYGNCNAMTAGPCNTDALTEFTLHCMESNYQSYYVQVVTPEGATGSLTLTVRADSSPNQACQPFNPLRPVANFTVINGCAGDSICFINQSTQGDSIIYYWNFGDPTTLADTSHAFNACWLYPYPLGSDTVQYNVMLVVTNISNGLSDTVVIPVPVYPVPSAFITRDPPQNGYYILGNVPVNFHSNPSNTISAPPSVWIWDLGNGSFSNDTNPSGVLYGPNDIGLNVVTLYLINGACTLMVRDTFYVKLDDVYKGGFYDGSSGVMFLSSCPADSVWQGGPFDGFSSLSYSSCLPVVFYGGPYDGFSSEYLAASCPPDYVWFGGPYDGFSCSLYSFCYVNVFGGGFNDGSSISAQLAYCPPDSVWLGGPFDGFSGMFYSSCVPISFNGGFYDGASYNLLASYCPPDSIWIGGLYDGESVNLSAAYCPPAAVWSGGPYDGESMGIIIANCPQDAVWFGGPYDGSSFEKFLAQCTTNVFKGGFYDGFSSAMDHCGSPLPVEYLYLRAYWQGKDGVLNWAIATETNNYGFIVEKLVNNQFTQVGFVPGAGNSNNFHEYFWIDYNLYFSAENNFIYRIKQIDIDGNYKTSNIVILTKENYFYTNSEKFQILRIYPNPSISNQPIYLLISSLEKLNVNLEIVTLQGEVLYKFMKQINEGLSTIKLENITLQPSTYLLMVKYENEKYVLPFFIVE